MNVKPNAMKEMLTIVGLDGLARECLKIANPPLWRCKRLFGLVDRKVIADYLRANRTRKLHIGCGNHVLDGWLNSDHLPGKYSTLQMDATRRFPLPSDQFDYIFTEHMIEHINYHQGARMLRECFRVLRGRGKIRISTPNLAFLIDLYRDNKTEFQTRYVRWDLEAFLPSAPYFEDTFLINNFVRAWGHQFIYDEKTLRRSLEDAGFTDITRREICSSEDEALKNLENVYRMPPEYLQYQTLTLEAVKTVDG